MALRRVLISLFAALLPAAESGGQLALFGPLWPRLQASLPTAAAGAHLGVASDGGVVGDGSLYALGMVHVDPSWSYGLGLGWSGRDVPDGYDAPSRLHGATALLGGWRRLGVEQHVLIVVAPSLTWAEGGGHAQVSVAGLVAAVDRGGPNWLWAVGLAGYADGRNGLLLPYAAALFHPGEWRFVLSPVYLSGERLLGAHAAVGVQGTVGGNSALVDTPAGRRTLTLWEVRTGTYLRLNPTHGPVWTIAAGYAPVRRLDTADGLFGGERSGENLGGAPYAALDAAWTW